jgi:hypothetical protein
MSWLFERYSPMGGASASAYRNTLAGAGVPPTEVFVREVLQNSVDAALSDAAPIRVVFRSENLDGPRLEALRNALELHSGSPVLTRAGLLADRASGDVLRQGVRVLFVEDFETRGLGGTDAPTQPSDEDNYRRLCLELGVTGQGAARGGTFGYGKAAYWAVSELWTVIFYSRFRATARTRAVTSRLIGVSWFNEHLLEDPTSGQLERYTGRAWFGHVEPASDICHPFVNAEADRRAGDLGFAARGPNDTGTSAMILAHVISPQEIGSAVESNWWPRLLDGRLLVELPDGTTPAPRSNAGLRPFIHCWDLIREHTAPGDLHSLRELTYRSHALGRLALTAYDEELGEGRRAQIALVRGPGMKVTVLEAAASAPSQPLTVGVFLGDPAMESAFATSEPPAHDRWDAETTRTDRSLDDPARQRIKKTLEKIKSEVREFMKAHQEPPPTPPPRCRELEKLLGSFFATKPAGPQPPPPPDSDIFSLRFAEKTTREVSAGGDDVRISATLELTANESAFADGQAEIVVRLSSWVDLLLDGERAAPRAERLKMTYMRCDDPKDREAVLGVNESDATVAELLMCRDEGVWRIEVLSDALPHPEYAARLGVLVERL